MLPVRGAEEPALFTDDDKACCGVATLLPPAPTLLAKLSREGPEEEGPALRGEIVRGSKLSLGALAATLLGAAAVEPEELIKAEAVRRGAGACMPCPLAAELVPPPTLRGPILCPAAGVSKAGAAAGSW